MHLACLVSYMYACTYCNPKMTNVDRHCQAIIPVIFNTQPPSQSNVKSTPVQSNRRTTALCMSPLVTWYDVRGKGLYIAYLSANVCRQETRPHSKFQRRG